MRRFLSLLVVLIVLSTVQPARSQSGSGFTFLLTLGYGLQSDEFFNDLNDKDEWRGGLSGLSLGIGGFAAPNFAIMARLAGTNVTQEFDYPFGGKGETDNVAGVLALDGQYWFNNRFNLEAGAGWGFVDTENSNDPDRGLGLFLGAGFSILPREKHSLQIGVEYAPVFADERTVHSIGLNVGFQFL